MQCNGAVEEVDSLRGGNHTQTLVEERFEGVHGLFGVGGFLQEEEEVLDTEEVVDIEEEFDISLEL